MEEDISVTPEIPRKNNTNFKLRTDSRTEMLGLDPKLKIYTPKLFKTIL
jgi:hypothetical protein